MTAQVKTTEQGGTTRIELTRVWVAWLPILVTIAGIIYSAAIANAARPERDEVKVMVKDAVEQSKETFDARIRSLESRMDEIGDIVKEVRDDIRELRKEKRP